MMKRLCAWGLAVALLVTLTPAEARQGQTLAADQSLVRTSAEAITAAQLKDYLSLVASDEMEGRADPSRGLDLTARFLATMLSRSGVKGAGDEGGYYQKIALKRDRVVADGTTVELGGRSFAFGKDFLHFPQGWSGTVSGTMVFASHGWFVKSRNIDPYKDVDPKGKIVIISGAGLPPGVTNAELTQGKAGEDWMSPYQYAEKKGAVGVIDVNSLINQASPDSMERSRKRAEEGSFIPEKLPRTGQSSIPRILANYPLVAAIFTREKVTARAVALSAPPEGKPIDAFELAADKTLAFTVKTAGDTAFTQNVVAVIEGSDPVLKNEYVALGAHYDHVGTRTTPGPGDNIYNGADDDGSGTVALLAMAEALAKTPRRPKRSVLFVWHMGEEMGLWGSQYFATFPTVPIDRIVAQLNIDMIGRSKAPGDTNARNRDLSGPNELYVIGSKMMSTKLGQISEAVNAAYLNLSFNYKYDDPKDPEQFFYRSDHIHYALKNIPIIFYFTGPHAEYHQPGDEVSTIDFQKYEKVTRTIYATLWEIGELKTRPTVDKPLPDDVRRRVF